MSQFIIFLLYAFDLFYNNYFTQLKIQITIIRWTTCLSESTNKCFDKLLFFSALREMWWFENLKNIIFSFYLKKKRDLNSYETVGNKFVCFFCKEIYWLNSCWYLILLEKGKSESTSREIREFRYCDKRRIIFRLKDLFKKTIITVSAFFFFKLVSRRSEAVGI